MTRRVAPGRRLREAHFQFSPAYTPINHGSFGTYPRSVHEAQDDFTRLSQERPDVFIVRDLPVLIDASRTAVAPLLGADVDEVVLVPNATTAVNTVLRNLSWAENDVIVYFSTIYSACQKTIAAVGEHSPLEGVRIPLTYPVTDEVIVTRLRETVGGMRGTKKRVRMAMFDTVLTFPGARMPWEALVKECKDLGILSLIDGAHGIGHIDLTHLHDVSPDFFVSNCHKWLYCPRPCAVFFVPKRNQHLIQSSLPTSHGYRYPEERSLPLTAASNSAAAKSAFVQLFEFVATTDYTPYACIPAALDFRDTVCGGEAAIRAYTYDLARVGGDRVAKILETEVMDNGQRMRECCFANVRLPLRFRAATSNHGDDSSSDPHSAGETSHRSFDESEARQVAIWLNSTAVREFDTYFQIAFVKDSLWIRVSAQMYLELDDFEKVAHWVKELCRRLNNNEEKSIYE